MKSIFEACEPRPEILSGEIREELFAARLRDVIERTADPVYRDPDVFFANTYPTEGLSTLLDEALGRVTGAKPANAAIIRLETSFGGGKTHNLIALYHAAAGHSPGSGFVSKELVPKPGAIRTIGIVGSDLNPSDGVPHGKHRVFTLWGEIACQFDPENGYDLVTESERNKSAPGAVFLDELVGDQPTLILLDEVARYLKAAMAVPTATGKSDLAEQTTAFLMSLCEFAASKEQVVLVLTLASSGDAFVDVTEDLRQKLAEAKKVVARQERVITPFEESEIAPIVTHRLFESADRDAGEAVSEEYLAYFKRCVDRGADLPDRSRRAQYAQDITADYPFHPELITTLNRKTSTIPNFQKTRGALRLLAMVVRSLWEKRPPETYLIHPYHLDLGVEDIAGDLTSRLDRPAFKQVIEADIASPRHGFVAHAQEIDKSWDGEFARRSATAIFLHSLTHGVAGGVDPADLNLAVLRPDEDPMMVRKAAERLADECWFLDWDGRRYRFTTEVQLPKIIADEKAMVGKVKAKAHLESRIRQIWKKGYLEPVFFCSEPGELDDDAGKPKLAIIHFDAATSQAAAGPPPDLVMNLADHAGAAGGFRRYRNNVLFLVPDEDQVQNMVDAGCRHLAIGRILADPQRMGEFSKENQKKLKGMAEASELDVRVAVTKAYRYLYYPSAEAPRKHSSLAREILPPQDQGDTKLNQTDVVLRVLHLLQKVLAGDDKSLSPQYLKAKAWDKDQTHITTEDLRRAFARKMGLKILLDVNQLKRTIALGIQHDVWVYYDSSAQMGYDKDSRPPLIQIGEDALLFTPEEAERRGFPIQGREGPVIELKCPVCGKPQDECICGPPPPEKDKIVAGSGAPGQAFQAVVDGCHDAKMESLSGLEMTVKGQGEQGAREIAALGLAVPQLGKGDFWIEQTMTAEFQEGESLQITFKGTWDRYKRMKQVTDAFAGEASSLDMRATLRARFTQGLKLQSDQFETIREVFGTLGFGEITVRAEPLPQEDGE